LSSRTSRAAAPIRDLLGTGSDKQIPDESASRLSGMTREGLKHPSKMNSGKQAAQIRFRPPEAKSAAFEVVAISSRAAGFLSNRPSSRATDRFRGEIR